MSYFDAITIVAMLFASCAMCYVVGYVSALQDEQARKKANR